MIVALLKYFRESYRAFSFSDFTTLITNPQHLKEMIGIMLEDKAIQVRTTSTIFASASITVGGVLIATFAANPVLLIAVSILFGVGELSLIVLAISIFIGSTLPVSSVHYMFGNAVGESNIRNKFNMGQNSLGEGEIIIDRRTGNIQECPNKTEVLYQKPGPNNEILLDEKGNFY